MKQNLLRLTIAGLTCLHTPVRVRRRIEVIRDMVDVQTLHWVYLLLFFSQSLTHLALNQQIVRGWCNTVLGLRGLMVQVQGRFRCVAKIQLRLGSV